MTSRALSYLLFLVLFISVELTSAPPTPKKFEKAISDNISKVAEFEFIRAEAERLGIRVYLFGGTAAGYAHYVKWDLESKAGDSRFQKDRFDYDYTNIFRSTQDLDIVVDGSSHKAAELQRSLQAKFPYFTGSKESWEVRLLRQTLDSKEALLNNPDFLNQHTDSNSTGMIEITHPPPTESAIRDLRDWDSKKPFFFEDVRLGKLHYYFSEKHSETNRAKQGLNPPILSVIRYLTKAFQYELEIFPEDLAKIKKIIDDFNPSNFRSGYVRNWIEKNAQKLFSHATNIEYAWKTIDELGLRQKLMRMGNTSQEGSLAWWMNKEPLKTSPLGRTGKTARELGIDTVAHETRTFLAYESITRSPKGEPNVFISRDGYQGEAAAYGNGFYTRVGRRGARDTGLTIRFKLNPEARLGTDFTMRGDFVVVTNRAALEVIPESLKFGPVEFFDVINQFDDADRGLLEKLKRRVTKQLRHVTETEKKQILEKLSAQRGAGNNQLHATEALEILSHANFTLDETKELLHLFPDVVTIPKILRNALPQATSVKDFTDLIEASRRTTSADYFTHHTNVVFESIAHFKSLDPDIRNWTRLIQVLNAADEGNPAKLGNDTASIRLRTEILTQAFEKAKTPKHFLALISTTKKLVDNRPNLAAKYREIIKEVLLPKVKSSFGKEDYLALLSEPTVYAHSEIVAATLSSAKESGLDFSFEELYRAHHEIPPDSVPCPLTTEMSERVKTWKDFRGLVDLLVKNPITKGKEFFFANREKLVQLAPNLAEAIEVLNQIEPNNRHLINIDTRESLVPLTKTAQEFVSLFTPIDSHHSKNGADNFLKKNVDWFLNLNPTAEQFISVADRTGYVEGKTNALSGFLSKTKSASDFVKVAHFSVPNPSDAYQKRLQEILNEQKTHFFGLNPTIEDFTVLIRNFDRFFSSIIDNYISQFRSQNPQMTPVDSVKIALARNDDSAAAKLIAEQLPKIKDVATFLELAREVKRKPSLYSENFIPESMNHFLSLSPSIQDFYSLLTDKVDAKSDAIVLAGSVKRHPSLSTFQLAVDKLKKRELKRNVLLESFRELASLKLTPAEWRPIFDQGIHRDSNSFYQDLAMTLPSFFNSFTSTKEFIDLVGPGQTQKNEAYDSLIPVIEDRFLELKPSAEELKKVINHTNNIAIEIAFKEKASKAAITPQHMLVLLELSVSNPNEKYLEAMKKFITENVNRFFQLNPSPQELGAFFDLLSVRKLGSLGKDLWEQHKKTRSNLSVDDHIELLAKTSTNIEQKKIIADEVRVRLKTIDEMIRWFRAVHSDKNPLEKQALEDIRELFFAKTPNHDDIVRFRNEIKDPEATVSFLIRASHDTASVEKLDTFEKNFVPENLVNNFRKNSFAIFARLETDVEKVITRANECFSVSEERNKAVHEFVSRTKTIDQFLRLGGFQKFPDYDIFRNFLKEHDAHLQTLSIPQDIYWKLLVAQNGVEAIIRLRRAQLPKISNYSELVRYLTEYSVKNPSEFYKKELEAFANEALTQLVAMPLSSTEVASLTEQMARTFSKPVRDETISGFANRLLSLQKYDANELSRVIRHFWELHKKMPKKSLQNFLTVALSRGEASQIFFNMIKIEIASSLTLATDFITLIRTPGIPQNIVDYLRNHALEKFTNVSDAQIIFGIKKDRTVDPGPGFENFVSKLKLDTKKYPSSMWMKLAQNVSNAETAEYLIGLALKSTKTQKEKLSLLTSIVGLHTPEFINGLSQSIQKSPELLEGLNFRQFIRLTTHQFFSQLTEETKSFILSKALGTIGYREQFDELRPILERHVPNLAARNIAESGKDSVDYRYPKFCRWIYRLVGR